MNRRALVRRLWAPLFVLLLVSGVVSSLLRSEQPLVQTRTSYGGISAAWGAAFDLLQELSLAPQRTREALAARDLARPQWIVEPAWQARELPRQLEAIEQFVRRGGTVVLVGGEGDVLEGLGFGAGLRVRAASEAPAAAATRPVHADEPLLMQGRWLRSRRRVALRSLFAADAVRADEVRASGPAGVLALERTLGAGKLVVLSDGAFFSNQHLDEHDNAALLVDLALALGPPVFDERCHGLFPERSPWRALGAGFVALVALSFATLTLGALLYARRWPVRRARPLAPEPPSLELFVGSLAGLYRARGQREPAAVFRAYRAGLLRRLGRGLHDTRALAGAVARGGNDARWFSEQAAPASRLELAQAVAALERYAAAAHGERKR
jgi:hypothetical protein